MKTRVIILLLILFFSFLVRLKNIDSPVANWHSWRQADTAAVSRNFFKEGFNPFLPKYDDMSAVSDGKNINLKRLRLVEFPIYNSLVYFAYSINGGVDERLARLVSIFFSLGSILFLFLISKKYFGFLTGILSAATFAFLPFNIYFSSAILPESSLVFFCLGMFYFLDRWISSDKFSFAVAGCVFMMLSFLTKPTAVFYLLPIFVSIFEKEKKLYPIQRKYLLIFILGILPFIAWRIWISFFPEGIPAAGWLLNGNGIRFRPAFWKWIIAERLGKEILSPTGLFLFLLGVLIKPLKKESGIPHILALSSFLYLIIVATGNVQHDYYQYLITPVLCIFVSRGVLLLIEGIENFIPRLFTIPLAILFFTLIFYLTWNETKGFYQINNPVIIEAGIKANNILPKDAVVIAPYNGDSAFLYQINRPGFPVVTSSIEEMRDKYGVTHFVSVNFDDDTNQVSKMYKILEKNSKFIISDLRFSSSGSALIKLK